MATPADSMLTEAIAAARTGDRARARDLLTRLLRADSGNAEYWVWMSAVVDSNRERVYCLESALKLDPTNRSALRGLVILGARKPEKAELAKAPKIQRSQAIPVPSSATRTAGLNLNLQWVGIGALAILAVGIIFGGLFLFSRRPRVAASAPTLPPPTSTITPTPLIPTATNTPIPVETRIQRTAIPTEFALTPIVFFVAETPTPTPVLGVTPHASYEAYALGLSALDKGDYETLLASMDQLIDLELNTPDVHYFRGEALRNLERPREAVLAYDRAILLAPDFAPAYLGRGRALLAITLREKGEIKPADLPQDFDRALERDPLYIEAYAEKASFYAGQRLWKTMEEMLQVAVDQGAQTPLLYVLLSDAQHNRANYEASLENAITGSVEDPTLLHGYLALGRAYVELEDYESALWPLQTYTVYRGDDHLGWGYLSRAQYGLKEFDAAFESSERSLAIHDRYAPAYLIRGLVQLEREEYQTGYQDLLQARRYGPETYPLILGISRALFLLENYVEALSTVNRAIEEAPSQAKMAEGYAIRALIYESTNPPLVDDAIRNWRWILEIEDADPGLLDQAMQHLDLLGAEPVTSTPDLPPTPGTNATPTTTPEAATPVP